jgi:hypothetical protein
MWLMNDLFVKISIHFILQFSINTVYLYTMPGIAVALRAPQFDKAWSKAMFLKLRSADHKWSSGSALVVLLD